MLAVLPVGCDVAHEQDAGVHVQVEGGGSEVAVDPTDDDGSVGVVGDPDGETEADEEVSGRHVLQVDGDAAGYLLLSSAEVNLQGEAVEEQTHLTTTVTGFDLTVWLSSCLMSECENVRLTMNTRL